MKNMTVKLTLTVHDLSIDFDETVFYEQSTDCNLDGVDPLRMKDMAGMLADEMNKRIADADGK